MALFHSHTFHFQTSFPINPLFDIDCLIDGTIELLGHCKGGNFNIQIWVWFGYFICSRREIRFYLIGKVLKSCLSRTNVRAFHENPDRMFTLDSHLLTLKAHIRKSRMFFLSAEIFEASSSNSLIWHTACLYTYVNQ